jgi:predicted alpha/beta-hydrolase family hydrolase
MNNYETKNQAVKIPIGAIFLDGILSIPKDASGIIIFVHGSGSSRLSPRNKFVAEYLENNGFSTLLFDLLTEEEDQLYENRFDIDLLAGRLEIVTNWVMGEDATNKFKIGYFGASTGSAATIKAAVGLENRISAQVSRGGRVDLAAAEISDLRVPTLLIIGEDDEDVLELNKIVFDKLKGDKKLSVVSGATHLFEEEGALEEVASLAVDWFKRYI